MRSEFREVEVFISSDGQEFFDDSLCYKHELKIDLDRKLSDVPIKSMAEFIEFYEKHRDLINLPEY